MYSGSLITKEELPKLSTKTISEMQMDFALSVVYAHNSVLSWHTSNDNFSEYGNLVP